MFEDHVLNKIEGYLDPQVKLECLQFVSRDMHAFAWNPEFSPTLIIEAGSLHMQLVRSDISRAKLLYSRLKRIRLVGPKHTEVFEEFVQLNHETVEFIELIKPDSSAVRTLMDCLPKLQGLRYLYVSETELESVEDLDVFAINLPKLEELIVNEVFMIRGLSSTSTPVSPNTSLLAKSQSLLERLDIYILPFGELLEFLKRSFSHCVFPSLRFFHVRCLSSPAHADQLANVIEAKVPSQGWNCLQDVDVGIVTDSLVSSLKNVCTDQVRSVCFSARLETDLGLIAEAFPLIRNFSARVKHNAQLLELVHVISDSSWSGSLKNFRVSWSVVNSMSAETLVRLRISLGRLGFFHASARLVTACTETRPKPMVQRGDGFEIFFIDICKDRIVCECDECGAGTGDVNPAHILELAREEWDCMDQSLKAEFLSVVRIRYSSL
jgi:hypothetical protein